VTTVTISQAVHFKAKNVKPTTLQMKIGVSKGVS